jgi:hypothetical protein
MFEQRCRALAPEGEDAYAIHRAMSAFAHPSSTLADHYLVATATWDERSGIELRTFPEQPDHDTSSSLRLTDETLRAEELAEQSRRRAAWVGPRKTSH